MFKTISYHYKINDKNILKILQFLCHVSKNVYNTALYELRKADEEMFIKIEKEEN